MNKFLKFNESIILPNNTSNNQSKIIEKYKYTPSDKLKDND